jgi:hypothetical protein
MVPGCFSHARVEAAEDKLRQLAAAQRRLAKIHQVILDATGLPIPEDPDLCQTQPLSALPPLLELIRREEPGDQGHRESA